MFCGFPVYWVSQIAAKKHKVIMETWANLKDITGEDKAKNRNPLGVWTSISSVRTKRGLKQELERLMKPAEVVQYCFDNWMVAHGRHMPK